MGAADPEPMAARAPTTAPGSPVALVSADALRPRPLWQGELPEPGDVHFAVGLAKGSPVVSRVIAVGTASRTNHVGIITDVDPPHDDDAGWWEIVESLSKGVVEDRHRPPPNSTVIRLSDDPQIRQALVNRARQGAHADPHIAYDWWAIARIVFVGLLGRVPFLTFLAVGSPLVAAFVGPWWLALIVELAAIVVLIRLQPVLFRWTMALPWPYTNEPYRRLICSAFGRLVIQDVFGPGALPGLQNEQLSITAPGDLLQELLHRCDYWKVEAGRPRAIGTLDHRSRREPRREVTTIS